jgi:hypothetical protein
LLSVAEANHRLSALPALVQSAKLLRECFVSGGVYHCGWTVDSLLRKTGGSHDQIGN